MLKQPSAAKSAHLAQQRSRNWAPHRANGVMQVAALPSEVQVAAVEGHVFVVEDCGAAPAQTPFAVANPAADGAAAVTPAALSPEQAENYSQSRLQGPQP